MKKIIIIFLLVVVVAGGFLGIKKYRARNVSNKSKTINAQGVPVVKVALTKDNDDCKYIIDYATDKGFFAKRGIDVQIVDADKVPYATLESKDADVMIGGINRPLSVFFNDVNPRLLFNAYRPFGVYALSRYDKEHINQIKKVVVNILQGENQQQVDLALSNLGLDPTKIEHVAAPTPQARIAMLINGDADFTVIIDRGLYDNNDQLKSLTLFGSDITQKNTPLLRSVVTTQDMIDSEPQLLQKFTSGFYSAMIDAQQNKEAAVAYAQNKFSFSSQQADEFYSQFIDAAHAVSFVPDQKDFANSIDGAKKDSTDPQRDINSFVFADYAKQATNQQ